MDLNVYLFFDGTCDEAFRHYERVLGGERAALIRYGEAPDRPPAFEGSRRILHTALRIGGFSLMGSDAPPPEAAMPGQGYEQPAGFRACLGVESAEIAERMFAGLGEGGRVEVGLIETFFAVRFGMLVDRFGIPWMVTCPKPARAGA